MNQKGRPTCKRADSCMYMCTSEQGKQSLSQPYPNARITLLAVSLSANKLYDIKRPLLQSSHRLGSVAA